MDFENDEQQGFEEAPESFLSRKNRNPNKTRKIMQFIFLVAGIVLLVAAGGIILLSGGQKSSQDVTNKKTLEIGGAEKLPERGSPENREGQKPDVSGSAGGILRLEAALEDMEKKMDENHDQLMNRLAELARRVVENSEQVNASAELVKNLETRLESLEKQYQLMASARSAPSARQGGDSLEEQKPEQQDENDKKDEKEDKKEKEESGVRHYKVKKDDTLFSIAKDHGIKLDTLLELNGLDRDSVIKPGDRLRVSR